ncbi:MAG: DUF3365 domain-containing protein [Planctomycetota bacterium]
MTRSLLLLLAITSFGLCSCGKDGTSAPIDETARIAAAKRLAQQVGANLLAELNRALELKDATTTTALGVCNTRAPAIVQTSTLDGLHVRRIGTRVRNKLLGSPDAQDKEALATFESMPPDALLTAQEVRRPDGQWRLYLPIVIQTPLCLRCHGPVDQIEQAVKDKLLELYPGDEATGYSIGDLRGAFVVETKQ